MRVESIIEDYSLTHFMKKAETDETLNPGDALAYLRLIEDLKVAHCEYKRHF